MIDRERGAGLALAAVGGVLQLVGLVWDGLMHYLDPGLAAREDLFTFANLSHTLLLVGLGLCVAGIVWAIAFTSSGTHRRARTAIGMLLVALVSANAVVAVLGASVGQAGAGHHGVSKLSGRQDETLDALIATVRRSGLAEAFSDLERKAATDSNVAVAGHDYAHALGEFAMTFYGKAPTALKNCGNSFLYGCYHGVLHAYFANKGTTRPSDVVGICTQDLGPLVRFQCLHGIGHGIYSNLDNDLFRSLTYCDALATRYERDSCYGGSFMQNILQAIDERGGRATAGVQGAAGRPATLKIDDPLYPCNAVADRYRGSCYQMQTSAMLLDNGRDYAAAAQSCDRAPSAYIAICLESLGRDISGDTLRDDQKVVTLCSTLTSPSRDRCFVGAVKNLFDAVERGIPFCRLVPATAKATCYEAVGEQLSYVYPNAADRTRVCAQSEPAFVATCEAKAGQKPQ